MSTTRDDERIIKNTNATTSNHRRMIGAKMLILSGYYYLHSLPGIDAFTPSTTNLHKSTIRPSSSSSSSSPRNNHLSSSLVTRNSLRQRISEATSMRPFGRLKLRMNQTETKTDSSSYPFLEELLPVDDDDDHDQSKNVVTDEFYFDERDHMEQYNELLRQTTTSNDDDETKTNGVSFFPFASRDAPAMSATTLTDDFAIVVTDVDDEDVSSSRTTTGGDANSHRSDRDVWIARVLLLAAAALYGTNFTLVKILDESIPVGASTSIRFALAGLATLPWFLMPRSEASRRDNGEKDDNDWMWLLGVSLAGLEIGAWNSVGYITQAIGLESIDASKSAFICSLAVVFVPILDYLAGKPPPLKSLLGAALAVLGVGFLECGEAAATLLPGMSSNTCATTPLLAPGDLISFVQPLAFGIGFWRMEHAMRRYPTEATRLTAGQLLAVGIVSVASNLVLGGVENLPHVDQIVTWITDPAIGGALLWTGLVTTALTIYMETVALKTLSAAETTLIFSTEPIWGSAFAAVVVGERFGIGAGLGAALILGGCMFSNWEFDSEKKEKEAS